MICGCTSSSLVFWKNVHRIKNNHKNVELFHYVCSSLFIPILHVVGFKRDKEINPSTSLPPHLNGIKQGFFPEKSGSRSWSTARGGFTGNVSTLSRKARGPEDGEQSLKTKLH